MTSPAPGRHRFPRRDGLARREPPGEAADGAAEPSCASAGADRALAVAGNRSEARTLIIDHGAGKEAGRLCRRAGP